MNRNLASSQLPFQKIANCTEFFLPRRYRRQSKLSSELAFLHVEPHIVPAYRGDERGFHPARTPADNDHAFAFAGRQDLTFVAHFRIVKTADGPLLRQKLHATLIARNTTADSVRFIV